MSNTLKKLLIVTPIGALCAVAIGWSQGLFSAGSLRDVLRILSDGFFVAGGLMLAFGALVWTSNGGAFDGLTFSVKSLFWRLRRDYEDVKLTFAEYRQQREAKASSPRTTLLSGAILMALALVFLLLYSYI